MSAWEGGVHLPLPGDTCENMTFPQLLLLMVNIPQLIFVKSDPLLLHSTSPKQRRDLLTTLGVFTNSTQYRNANIANFVLALPLEGNWTNVVCNLKTYSYYIN